MRLSWLFVIALIILPLQSQRPMRLLEYNVENLFDTLRCPETNDTEYFPSGTKRWNTPRYMKKIGLLARAIVAAGGDRPADLVVLCEVENDSVVSDLINKTSLRRLGYSYIVTHGLDPRGINIALLYRPLHYSPVLSESLRPFSRHGGWSTRDILHVCGITHSGDTLDIFGVHLPSRSGGTQSFRRRREIAVYLRTKADSIAQCRIRPRIIIAGDFNDERTDACIRKDLCGDGKFVVLRPQRSIAEGTYKYKGQWNELDHFVVNAGMYEHSCISAEILAPGFLLAPDETHGGYKPRRTYQGPIYKGGLSDHLPIMMEFVP